MTSFAQEVYLSWLAGAGIPAGHLRDLLAAFPDPAGIHAEFARGHAETYRAFLPGKTEDTLRQSAGMEHLEKLAGLLAKNRIQTVVQGEPGYPDVLLTLDDPPAILFYQGDLSLAGRASAAMIGSRSASWKGVAAAEKTARILSENGIVIISGLAYGIDAAAHRGCLKGKSPTIAVLGCGLDQDYPAENAALRREILEHGGLLLSEYAPGDKPLGWHFPVRNRIISGLADCLIVMEARIRSGSMTTVQHALAQGRDVFVYPGEPDNPKTEGNHLLLREGAIFFTSAEDIMEDMHWLDKKKEVRHNSDCAVPGVELSPAEKGVMDRLASGEQSFDQLCAVLNRPAGELMSLLTVMQIRGLIEAMPGKLYRIRQD